MRIAIPTTGKRKLTNKVADTFSRASTFTVITLEDLENQNIEEIEKPASTLEQGARPIAAHAHLHTYTPKNPSPH